MQTATKTLNAKWIKSGNKIVYQCDCHVVQAKDNKVTVFTVMTHRCGAVKEKNDKRFEYTINPDSKFATFYNGKLEQGVFDTEEEAKKYVESFWNTELMDKMGYCP